MSLFEGIGKVPTSSLLVPAGACIAGGIVGGLIMKSAISRSSATDKLPEKWVKVGNIKELVIYPVKSVPGNVVNEAIVGKLGLRGTNNPLIRDRVFAVINSKDGCVTQRQIPVLALVQVKIEGNQLHLSYTKDTSLDIAVDIPTSGRSSGEKVITIWGEKVKAVDCGDKVAAWLSKLGETEGLRMVYHLSEEPQREAPKRNLRFPGYRQDHTGTFQDETSYMLMTDESVAAVNAHLTTPISHKNFRPSIVVSGSPEPFNEDFWSYIRIGEETVLKSSMPCQRCTMTTIDPETGKTREDGEPLKTLYKLKRPVGDAKVTKLVSKAAILGAHFGVFSGEGNVIRVGDPIYAALL